MALVALLAGLATLPACATAAGAATFERRPVGAPSADAFLETDSPDEPAVVPPANVKARAYSAEIPGLYAAPTEALSYDAGALTRSLNIDPARAKAWAEVLDIDPGDIATYTERLTPVVLRTDTAVTDHGFRDGETTRDPVVLQAGSAVLVDDRGVPVMQVNSGDPLTAAPSTKDAKFTGADWTDFAPDAVTTIEPADGTETAFVLADGTGTGIVRPIGTSGALDRPYDPNIYGDAGQTPDGAGTGGTSAVDDAGPASDDATDTDSPAENPDGTVPAEPAGLTVSLAGNAVPGAECFGGITAPVTVEVSGSEGAWTITLPSYVAGGFTGLIFGVNPDHTIDSEVSYEPPGAPGLTVTYHFTGTLETPDPPTPWRLTGTLTVSGAGVPTCGIAYDASGQSAPTPSPSQPLPPTAPTTYVATYGMAGSADAPGGVTTSGCARSGMLDQPFSITIRVREGVDGGEVRVVGDGGPGSGTVAFGRAVPRTDLRGGLSDGRFSVGGSVTYDDDLQGNFSSRWSGGVGARRTRPAEFQLRIHQTWELDRDVVAWLTDSGGPDDFDCTYDVLAIRQAGG